jgi:hypothetical protein
MDHGYQVSIYFSSHCQSHIDFLLVRPVVLKPGVATHLCVAKILQCVAKIEYFLKLSKKVNHSYHTKGFCWRLFAHCPYTINLSLHKRYYSVDSCFSKQLNGLNLVY